MCDCHYVINVYLLLLTPDRLSQSSLHYTVRAVSKFTDIACKNYLMLSLANFYAGKQNTV